MVGIFISGHPLNDFKLEMDHFVNGTFQALNEDIGKLRMRELSFAGVVTEASERMSKNGKLFGILTIEDYSGKSEFFLWSEDYVRYTNYLEKGIIVLLEGGFKTRYNSDQYEFKLGKLHLLETVKSALTKQVVIDIEPQFINETLIDFIDNNIKAHPGKTSLKFNIKEITFLGKKLFAPVNELEFITTKYGENWISKMSGEFKIKNFDEFVNRVNTKFREAAAYELTNRISNINDVNYGKRKQTKRID